MIAIIVGMTKQGVIGKDNSLPWHIPEDLKNFKRLTNNNVVIMGRKTYDSLPAKFKPLPNRQNVVVSRSMQKIAGIDVCNSIEDALETAKSYQKDIFIIGGSTIYKQFLDLADTMLISYIKQNYEGDTYFPSFDNQQWKLTNEEEFDDFTLTTYKK